MKIRRFFLLLLALLITPSLAGAQVLYKLTGQVVDDLGQAVPGVTVRLSHPSGGLYLSTAPDAAGNYAFPSDRLDEADWAVSVVGWPTGYTLTSPERVDIRLTRSEPEAVVDFSFNSPRPRRPPRL